MTPAGVSLSINSMIRLAALLIVAPTIALRPSNGKKR